MPLAKLLLSSPRIETWKLVADPLFAHGPCVALVVSGQLRVSAGPAASCCEVARLGPEDLLGVPPGRRVRLCAAFGAELVAVRAPEAWREELGEADAAPHAGDALPFFVDRAGTDVARRARRLLREQDGAPESAGPAARCRDTARALEALAIAFEERGSVLLPYTRRGGSAGRSAFRAALAALAQASLEEVTLASFARRVGLSERQVSRLFREELGKTWNAHVAELRLARARRLLRDTDYNVVDVAGETGWRSLAHFNAVFRQRTGLTPSAYRERARSRDAAR
jgi:AraC-like DNA-binding protein